MGSITNNEAPKEALFQRLRIALGVVLFAALAVGVRFALQEHSDPRSALALLRSVDDQWWSKPAFLLSYIAATAVFLPAVLFHMISGAAWGFGVGVALNFVAVNSSASLQFLFARKLGRERLARLLPARHLRLFDGAAVRHGYRTVVAVRMLPLPHMAVNVAAGISAMRWRDFALGSVIGTLPVVLVYTYLAASLVEGVAGAQGRALLHLLGAGTVVLLAVFVPRLVAHLRSRRARNEAAQPPPAQ
ncbi:MAG: TVP38/TMEM64 family protein [Myxococcaceae bacterium]